MSQWTHVNAAIRIDGVPQLWTQPLPDLGKTCTFESEIEDYDACDVPCGSEGSLQYRAVEYDTGLPWLAIHIWGDLRDYSDVEEIMSYLQRIIEGQIVRSGIAEIYVEGRDAIVLQVVDVHEKPVWQKVLDITETRDANHEKNADDEATHHN